MKSVVQNAERFGRDRLLPFLFKIIFPQKKNFYLPSSIIKKILLVKTHHKIGDLLLGSPLIRNIKHAYPHASIDFFAGEYCLPAIKYHPDLRHVFVFKKRPVPTNLMHDIQTILELRKNRYDICMAISASSFSVTNSLIAKFCRAKLTVGLEGPNKYQKRITDILYDISASIVSNKKSETDQYLDILIPLQVKIVTKDELIGFSREDASFADRWIKELLHKAGNKIIGIHPGGTYQERQWPIDKFIELIKNISNQKGFKIVLFRGKNEDKLIQEIISMVPGISIVPDVDFTRLAALQSRMDIFIGNDTGTLHSAVSTGIPCIGLYMTTNSTQWAPLNRNLKSLHNPDVKKVISCMKKILSHKKPGVKK